MKRKQCSAEHMMRIVHEAEPRDKVREVCRQSHVTTQTLPRAGSVARWRGQTLRV
jgi:hypothetical protein